MKTFQRCSGGSIAEFGPALFVLLIIGFFPLLDMLQVMVGYGGCWYLNSQQSDLAAQSLRVRTVSPATTGTFVNQTDVQTQLDTLATDWKKTPLGCLSKLQSATTTIAGPTLSGTTGTYLTCYVQVTTAVKCASFLTIPFFSNVPGLGADVNISITGQRVVEDATQ